MTQPLRLDDYHINPEQYLAAEQLSEVKHEYVAGRVYAMAGATADHQRIANNVLRELGIQLRGQRCEVFGPDLRVRIPLPSRAELYYYPDAVVDCSRLPGDALYAEAPVAIFEVLSPDTARIDAGEKLASYRTLPSLRVYALIEQTQLAVTIYRRTAGEEWAIEFLGQLGAVLELPEIACRLPLAAIYERVLDDAPQG